ncbi:MAG: monovalent cation/H+ antiporter subunit D family protein [Gammaproteobacteria bacterium]|nr:monovalent cation/H+ antiporter subunit D family protein [Gammaproteobacteria bacterium]
MSAEQMMLFTLVLPLLGGIGVMVSGRYPNLRESVTLITAAVTAVLVVTIASRFLNGEAFHLTFGEVVPGIAIAFEIEASGMIFALVAGLLWIVTSIYAIGYMRGHNEKNQTRFFTAFAVAISCALGIAFSANLFTLFLFYELLTLSTYPLVVHSGTDEARRGGRVYLGLLLGTSIGLFLPAIIITWMVTGSVEFEQGGILEGKLDPAWGGLLYALFLFGIGKAALMPFHRWLPAAMVAPTPVSALLHAVAVVKAGVFTLFKVTSQIFGGEYILSNDITGVLVWVAAATILLASFVAMTKDNLKARLAYSTVSQLSYIAMGSMLATKSAFIGATMHIAMHAFSKITLFFAAGAIFVVTHKKLVSELDGLGRAMPITFGAFLIGTLSIIGLPPFGGLWSKWYLVGGVVETGQLLLLGVLMTSTLLNIIYLLPIPIRAFFSAPKEGIRYEEIKEAPMTILLAMIITSLTCILLFFYPDPLHQLASIAAGRG